MRKILLFLFSIFSFLAGAQKYRSIDTTLIWSTEEVGKNMASCYVQSQCKYYLKGFELNNSNFWYKIYKSYSASGISFPACTTFVSGPPVLNSFYGYVFDDTLNKKIYFKYSLPPNYTPVTSDLTYDFNNKNVGDTIYSFPTWLSSYRFGINSTDSVLFSGKYHKRYLTTIVPNHIFLTGKQITFTEGIGSSLGAFGYTINPMGEAWSYLLCFASPTQTMSITNHSVYTNSGSCSNITLGMNEKGLTKGGVFPNPASNYFSIENRNNDSEEITYLVYNSLGQIQLSGTFSGQIKINTETLSSGIYFVKLSAHSESETKKLMIQKE